MLLLVALHAEAEALSRLGTRAKAPSRTASSAEPTVFVEVVDEKSGKNYYVNRATNAVQWKKPTGDNVQIVTAP